MYVQVTVGLLQFDALWGPDVLVADVWSAVVVELENEVASMGPRRFSRGCPANWLPGLTMTYKLQWGRDVLVADVWSAVVVELENEVASMGPGNGTLNLNP